MCEQVTCNATGGFWVQGPKWNSIVCGRHLAKAIRRLGPPTTVKVRVKRGDRTVWK